MAICVLLFAALSCACAASIDNKGPEMSYDTIVIGLGAAGTTAASLLAKAGKRVLGLEAQDRIGGRVYTAPFGDGVVEVGAEWIHGTENSKLYELATSHNVPLTPQDISMDIFLSNGQKADKELVNELLEVSYVASDNPPAEAMPLGQHITNKIMAYIREKRPDLLNDQDFITEFLAFADLVLDNYEATNSWNDVTTDSKYDTLGGHQHMSWARNGYKTLFEILLNKYNNGPGLPTLETKLNTEVTQVSWPSDPSKKVEVTCADGSKYTADNAIVTVSVGVLKERYQTLFTPALPQKKVDAIQNLVMGLLGKIYLEFPEEWWPKGNNTFFGFLWNAEDKRQVKDDLWTLRLEAASHGLGSNRVLNVWTHGDTGRLVETLPEEEVKTKVMQLLRRFMGANVTIPEPIAMLRSKWHTNPYTRGSYTYDSITSPQHPTARADLMEPLVDSSGKPRVLFAGEATHPNHFSTVNGAVETGYREAMRLLPASKL